jgi:hypothetical protein
MTPYYVYQHKDPKTNEVVYVGMGSAGRAWDARNSSNKRFKNTAHCNWIQEQLNAGYLPTDYTTVLCKGLTREEALKLEHRLVLRLKPKFDKLVLPFRAKTFTLEQAKEAVLKYARGIGLTQIAREANQQGNLAVVGLRMVNAGKKHA